ncbi:hypothetical protein Purlil1_13915 [Purpureocillium lilacinum]|uniref:Uncharacterized protein n=1 Tax=Purpureocillium lilacinum TaxID=33203 RepID=A0ABR0BCS3_PURLI|nr:hypothetical protein Purlil1_13915 [Purpureocillium lilacinum]
MYVAADPVVRKLWQDAGCSSAERTVSWRVHSLDCGRAAQPAATCTAEDGASEPRTGLACWAFAAGSTVSLLATAPDRDQPWKRPRQPAAERVWAGTQPVRLACSNLRQRVQGRPVSGVQRP